MPVWALDPGTTSETARVVIRVDSRSGRLVRRVIAPRLAVARAGSDDKEIGKAGALQAAPGNPTLARLIDDAARAHDVDPLLVHSVIQVESNYDPFALSPKGAEGLMQLIPSTARRFGVRNPFDVRQNIEGGVKYLKYLQELFKDDRLALAAYNAGEGAVSRYGDIPPYRETQYYVAKVGKKVDAARVRQKERAQPPEAEKPEHPPLEHYLDANGRLHLRTR